jgi:uncharacterized protein (TIGR00645 family)
MPERLTELLENGVETFIFASRWLLAPFYVGLGLSIVLLLINFFTEFAHLVAKALSATEAEAILGVLSLVDLALTASLLIIVIFSGYENFVSKIDHTSHRDWPEWMGTIDFTALKLKLLSSIVAISGVQLLKLFMDLSKATDREIIWSVVIHVVFVISSLLLALSDRFSNDHGKSSKPAKVGTPSEGRSVAGVG